MVTLIRCKCTRLDVELTYKYSGITQWGFNRPEAQFLAAYALCQLVFHLDRKKKNRQAGQQKLEKSQISFHINFMESTLGVGNIGEGSLRTIFLHM